MLIRLALLWRPGLHALLPQHLPGEFPIHVIQKRLRHALYAPKESYAALELPGVREAVDAGDWAAAARELGRLTSRLQAVTAAMLAVP